jgi:hypothetical protein
VRPAARAALSRASHLGEALRAGREALEEVQDQLDALLAAVRAPQDRPDARPDSDSADRLRRAVARADKALAHLPTR